MENRGFALIADITGNIVYLNQSELENTLDGLAGVQVGNSIWITDDGPEVTQSFPMEMIRFGSSPSVHRVPTRRRPWETIGWSRTSTERCTGR